MHREPEHEVRPEHEFKPITRNIPWHTRQRQLEHADRLKAAQIKQEATQSVKSLEEELGVE